MKKRRKHSLCLNCGEPLDKKYNYCPNCGQENTDNHVSIGLLIREFTASIFSLDSRFAHTIKPFLFKPGSMTNAFLSGKRVFYANPVRWYLVISIFHFFFMSKMLQPSVNDLKERGFIGEEIELSPQEFDSLYNLPDTADSWPFTDGDRKIVNHLIEHSTLSDDQIYDTLNLNRPWFNELMTKKSIRISRETTASLKSYIFKQIPIITFFILPIYAFLLKLFFYRKGLYIKHLIHSLHLHSFYFFLLGIVWILALLFNDFEDIGIPIAIILTLIYAIISFRNVYQVKVLWSTIRALMIGFIYSIVMVIVLVIGMLISIVLL